MLNFTRRGVSPVIAIVLLLMMTVAAAGAAYFWITSMQSSIQESSYKSIENIMESTGRRVIAQATLCKPTYPYKGLKGYWMMDEGSGNYANDSSGNGNDGTLYPGSDGSITSTSGMWTDGKVGGALKFDGNDSNINIGEVSSLQIKGDLTILAWLKPGILDTDRKGNNVFVSCSGVSTEAESGNFLYSVNLDEKYDRLRYYHEYGHGNNVGLDIGSKDWGKNEWYQVAIVRDSNAQEVSGYVNGVHLKTTSYSNGPTGGDDSITSLGSTSSNNHYFNGTIDEVQTYNRALSKNEIKELYEAENHSARRRIDVTVRNIGSEEIPKATWVANLKQDGTTVETDAYNASSIDTGELSTLKFYFRNFKPNTEYTVELQGTGTSATVSC